MFCRNRPYAGIQVAATSKPLMFRIANGALGVFKRRPCLLASRFQTEPPANQIGEYPALHLPLDLRRTYTPPDSPKEYTLAGSGGVRLVARLPRHPQKEGPSCSGALSSCFFFPFLLYMDWWSQPGVISAASERIVTLKSAIDSKAVYVFKSVCQK